MQGMGQNVEIFWSRQRQRNRVLDQKALSQ